MTYRAVVTYGDTGSWNESGFDTQEAARAAAAVEASRIRLRGYVVSGYRAEPE